MNRVARHTRLPGILKEIYSELNNDPHLVAECLIRPILADRIIRSLYDRETAKPASVNDSSSPYPNGVIDPDELVILQGNLENTGTLDSLNTSGILSTTDSINIPGNEAIYGNILSGNHQYCSTCYQILAPSINRSAMHWDISLRETVAASGYGPAYFDYIYHIGRSFSDVSVSYIFYKYIETLFHYGITSGCQGTNYCPSNATQRQQMAKFIVNGFGFSL